MSKPYITQEEALAIFEYKPRKGDVCWRPRPKEWFKTEADWKSWTTRCEGRIAGGQGSNGHHVISYNGRSYKRTTLIWVMKKGRKPKGPILHINGDVADDRWLNLRETTMKTVIKKQRGRDREMV